MQLLAGTDAGTGARGRVEVWGGDSAVQLHSMGGVGGGGTHTHTHTKCSKSRDLVRLRFAIRIAICKSLAI